MFLNSEDGSEDYSWFLNAPGFTTFRVNVKKYKVQDLVDIIDKQFIEETEAQNKHPPKIFIHKIINDCIVVSRWKHDCRENLCEYDVIVDVACANAVLRGADIFAPGILSISTNAKVGDKVNVFADLERNCRRGFNKKFTGKSLLIGTGTVKVSRNELFKNNATVRGVGVEVDWNLSGIPKIKLPEDSGLLQNFPSIVCGHMFKNITGNVLDMCAAPGNKATHIATILGNKGEVIALDKTADRVSKIGKLSERFGLTNLKYYLYDATKCIMEDMSESNANHLGPPFMKESFPAVLLDPPCSALGQRPSLMNNISSSQLKSYVFLQRQLLRSAIKALSKGGLLVYSTCTITLEENEEMVSWALKQFPELSLKRVEPSIGYPGLQESSLTKNEREMVSRFGLPRGSTVDEDTIGFFIACFNKNV
ncbi:tRNA (cytosine(72)-C(5))-methyltransferase NSUN6 isoform X2 [Halyomorpha halys]